MANGGAAGSRGYIFQAVIALIECLEKDRDWDAIKNEPATEEEKVDIMLYKEEKIISAIQVKSSLYPFGKKEVEEWLGKLRGDAKEAEEVCLCLVGDKFTKECEDFINVNFRSAVPKKELMKRSVTFELPIKSPFFTVA